MEGAPTVDDVATAVFSTLNLFLDDGLSEQALDHLCVYQDGGQVLTVDGLNADLRLGDKVYRITVAEVG